jgi:hypothetical protein
MNQLGMDIMDLQKRTRGLEVEESNLFVVLELGGAAKEI